MWPDAAETQVLLKGVERHDAEAVERLDAVIARHPNDSEALVRRGNAYMRLDRPTKALADFDRVVARDPLSTTGWTDRGVALMMLGRLDEAEAAFVRSIRLWDVATGTEVAELRGLSINQVLGLTEQPAAAETIDGATPAADTEEPAAEAEAEATPDAEPEAAPAEEVAEA